LIKLCKLNYIINYTNIPV